MMKALKNFARISLLALFSAVSLCSFAAYPDRPVKIIVPFPPGGGNDQLGRLIGEKLSQTTAQPFVIENRGGAGGNLGAEVAARAAPDGYTLLMASNQVVINPSLYKDMRFDIMKDLVPVAMIADVQFLLVVNPDVKVKSISELIALDKQSKGKLNHGTPGSGTPQHLAAELFNSMAGTSLVHVPYKGSGPAISDLLGGQIQVAFATLPSVEAYAKAGRLTPIALTGKSRSPLLPDVPTIAEAGVKGYEASTWYGLLAPAGTPKAVLDLLEKDIRAALNDPEFRKRLVGLGFEPRFATGTEMTQIMKTDMAKWAKIVKDTNVKLE
ncbi:MAG TPA: tripartite tricarboxylate transporter substrate binding protein [Casimicrobiaceae bacterium]|nr:tripartite tricarboxylate transporter substrate binding protein [Casimicrobiaceae bacterium]